ncbi:MAG: serine hydrolase [Bacteroidetes bacterium]|nr:MAG: serine hydrolase [Bacteroidota bacterium]
MRLRTTVLCLLIGQLIFGQNRVQKIDSLLTSIYDSGKLNGNILIAEKGKVIYNRSFGLANEITQEKLNEKSVFDLGSIGKQFTAMAIVILKEQGKLNYDDKITKYLPELSEYSNLSIRNLLNHTGGLPDILKLNNDPDANEYYSANLVGKTLTNNDVITFFSKYKPKTRFEPNTRFEYSNTGYAFLESIIEKISGLTYAEYLDEVIFKPLKMNNTLVGSRRLLPNKINNYAYDYVYSDSLKKYCSPDSLKDIKIVILLEGNGGVHSTVDDLLKWDRALYTDTLISYSSMKDMFQRAELNDKTKIPYGFGWFLEDNPNFGKTAFHFGGWVGYSTFIERDIDNDKTIIILQNHSPVSFPINELRHIFYNKPYQNEITLSNEHLKKLVGTYKIKEGFELKISVDKEHLFVQATGQDAVPLFAENEFSFFAKVVDVQLQFEKNKKGEITHLYLLQNGNKTKAEKKK